MKRVVSAVLVIAMLMLCLSGCGGSGEKNTFPHNSSLRFTDSKNTIVNKENLELADEYYLDKEEQMYIVKDDVKSSISGIELSKAYVFNGDAFASVIYYSESGLPDEELQQIFNTLKNHFDSIYGKAEEYSENGYLWRFKDSQGNPLEAIIAHSTDFEDKPNIDIWIGIITD